MINRATKLRWRRRVRHSRVAMEDLSVQAEERLEKHLFRRLTRLYQVRRFILSWLALMGLLMISLILQTRALSSYYQSLQPVPGGTYTEGIIGSFTNANPLYATGSVDRAVSRLVFSGLLTHDENNELTGDLASEWSVDESERVYTFKLRPNVTWHDGQPLTARDVVFTYQTIQNPDTKSPLQTSWTGIEIEATDDHTVVFRLPNTLSAFPYAVTNGIVPRHLLKNVPVGQLRSTRFNTGDPVGSGPFKWDAIEVAGANAETRQERIGLIANENYYNGAPKLQRFIIRTFRDEPQLLEAFEDSTVNAMAGLNTLADTLKDQEGISEFSVPLTGQVAVFFNNSNKVMEESKLRQALVQAADVPAIIRGLDHYVISADSPLLQKHLGYNPKLRQFSTNLSEAKKLLDAAGWVPGEDGIRVKDDKRLRLELKAQSNSEYAFVTQQLQQQWRAVGVELAPVLLDESEFQNAVALHDYQALLYGISLGNDPDVFAYWHSSQANPTSASRLNLSEYRSFLADRALETGRTRSNPAVRAATYQPFLEVWRRDAPALMLYQPRFLYVTRDRLHGFDAHVMNNAIDRYNNVHNWMIREAKQTK